MKFIKNLIKAFNKQCEESLKDMYYDSFHNEWIYIGGIENAKKNRTKRNKSCVYNKNR